MIQTHTFDSTGEAYDTIQCSDDIKKGDTIIVPSEKVVGLAWAWPVALTTEHGEFHVITDPTILDDEFTSTQVQTARAEATRRGWPLQEVPA